MSDLSHELRILARAALGDDIDDAEWFKAARVVEDEIERRREEITTLTRSPDSGE